MILIVSKTFSPKIYSIEGQKTVKFVTNILNKTLISDIKLTQKFDNTQTITVTVDEKNKGAVVGKNGRNAEKARMLAKRYFKINNIQIL